MSNMRSKIMALLGKTVENGCTEEEAMAAAAKAKELIEKYGEGVLEEAFETHFFEAFANSLEQHIVEELVFGICAYCRVSPVRGAHNAGMSFFGPESATVFAEWLVPSLVNFVMRATEEHMKTYPRGLGIGDTKREKKSFAVGCARRIADRMKAQSQPWDFRTYLIKYQELKGIKLGKGKPHQLGRVKHGGMAAGAAAAEHARWDRPLNGGGGVRRIGNV